MPLGKYPPKVDLSKAETDLEHQYERRAYWRKRAEDAEAQRDELAQALELIEDGRRQPGLWANLSREEMQQIARAALAKVHSDE